VSVADLQNGTCNEETVERDRMVSTPEKALGVSQVLAKAIACECSPKARCLGTWAVSQGTDNCNAQRRYSWAAVIDLTVGQRQRGQADEDRWRSGPVPRWPGGPVARWIRGLWPSGPMVRWPGVPGSCLSPYIVNVGAGD
jgi:hypothetical protein